MSWPYEIRYLHLTSFSADQLEFTSFRPSHSLLGHAYYRQRVIEALSSSSYKVTKEARTDFLRSSLDQAPTSDSWLVLTDTTSQLS